MARKNARVLIDALFVYCPYGDCQDEESIPDEEFGTDFWIQPLPMDMRCPRCQRIFAVPATAPIRVSPTRK